MKLAMFSDYVIAIIWACYVFQPIAVLCANCLNHVRQEIAFRCKTIEPSHCSLHGLRARFMLLASIDFTFPTSCPGETELSDGPRQHQTLPDEGYEYH